MNKLVWITIGGVAVAVTSLAASICTTVRTRMTVKKLHKSLGDLEAMSEEKIPDVLIQKAVAKAADKQVDRYMKDTEDAVLRTAHNDLTIQARNAVAKYSEDIREKAAEEVARQVENLDVEQLKRRICSMAEEDVLKKLDGCMDQYAKKFADNLDNSRKVYDRIAKAAMEKELEDDHLRVVLI